jgi:beta-glucosidase
MAPEMISRPVALMALCVAAASGLLVPGAAGAKRKPSSKLPDYAAARTWARAIVPQMTLGEKLDVMASGAAVPRLGIPRLGFTDGPNGIGGIAGPTGTTAFPTGLGLAATWNTKLARKFGVAMAQEATGKSANLIAGPTVNLIRSPLWGRAAETFGEDPFLTGAMAADEVRGMQSQHVIAQIKHYVLNDQEQGRFGIPFLQPGTNEVIGEKGLWGAYIEPFRLAIQTGGAASVMCSYNEINGTQACQTPATMHGLHSVLGLQGFSGPDATLAVRDVAAAANAGLDNFILGAFPENPRAALGQAVLNGTVPEATVNAAVENVLTGEHAVGIRDLGPARGDVSTVAHQRLATTIGAQSLVVLQNRRRVLPLSRRADRIAVIGHNAGQDFQSQEGGSPYVVGAVPVTPLEGIRRLARKRVSFSEGTLGVEPLPAVPANLLTPSSASGNGLTGQYFSSFDWSGNPSQTRVDPSVDFVGAASLGGARSVRWTGTYTPQASGLYRFSLGLGGRASLYVNGNLVTRGDTEIYVMGNSPQAPRNVYQAAVELQAGKPVSIRIDYSTDPVPPVPPFSAELHFGIAPPDNLIPDAVRAARKADVAVVLANDVSGETSDRFSLDLPGDQNRLISAVARANPRTVVVLRTPGAVLTPWRKRVAGIVYAGYPNQRAGTAIANVLFGKVTPSGRLPVTFPRSADQGPAPGPFPYPQNTVHVSEGDLTGYRYYDVHHQRPAFPFGFGLSYTRFKLGKAKVRKSRGGFKVAVPVTNTGKRAGAQTIQVYLGYPKAIGEPLQLKGFARVKVRPGRTARARIRLSPNVLRTYSVNKHAYVAPKGRYTLGIGTSSRRIVQRIRIRR